MTDLFCTNAGTRRKVNVKNAMVRLCLLIGAVCVAQADEVSINSSASGNVDWNSAIWGDPAAVQTSGNNYTHDDSSPATLLGMGTTYGGFAGDRLTLDSGTVLFNKGGGSVGGAFNRRSFKRTTMTWAARSQ
jgi:hypothetical protein